MKQYILPIAILIWGAPLWAQQLPHRSNLFTDASFIWNPAMTASWNFMEFGANYRQQWLGFNKAPRTATAGIQFPFVAANMSVGGYLMHDEVGPLAYNSGAVSYSYKIRFNRGYGGQLAIGIMGSFGQYRFDGAQALATDPNDVLLLDGRSTAVQPNFGAGLYYTSRSGDDYDENFVFAGLAANQLLASDLTFGQSGNPANLRRALHANALLGARFHSSAGFAEPALWVRYATENVLHATLNFRYEMEEAFWAGLSYSTDQSVGLQAGFILTGGFFQDGQLRTGVQGTYNIGQLGGFQGAGMEGYIAYRFAL